MGFCVECGAEGKVYGGLCGRCLAERNTFFEVPENLDILECVHCHAYQVGGRWITADRGDAIRRALGGAVQIRPELASHDLEYTETPEDARNVLLTIEGRGRLDDIEVVEAHTARVRIKPGVCDVCSRRRGSYYEGILQVRATGRPLRPWEEVRVGELVGSRTHRREGRREFVAKEERVHGGVDYYLSSNALAKTLSKEVQAALGGAVTVSPKLHTRREGRDLYRVTYLVRLPEYATGDVVEVEDKLYQITGMGGNVTAAGLGDGSKRSFRSADMAGARIVERQELQAILVAQTPEEVQVLDPETYRTETLRKPEGFGAEGETLTLLRVHGTTYVAPLQATARTAQPRGPAA